MDVLEHSYLMYLESYGIKTIAIPNIFSQAGYYFDQFPIEGIILTGGEDVDPKLYGENIEWMDISPRRDQTEQKLLEIAMERKLPVFGICRGMQFINVFFGGKLVKNIKEEITLDHVPGKDHITRIINEKIISDLGKKEIAVNSYHNQAVTTSNLSPYLNAFAVAEHGIVEGLYHPSLPIMGIQWHPERKSPDDKINRILMEALVKKEFFWKK